MLRLGDCFGTVARAAKDELATKSSAVSEVVAFHSRGGSRALSSARSYQEEECGDEDLVEGAAVAFARELDLLAALEDALSWDEAEVRSLAAEAAFQAEEGKAALKKAKKAHHAGKREAAKRAKKRFAAPEPLLENDDDDAAPEEEQTTTAAPEEESSDVPKLEAVLVDLSTRADELMAVSSKAATDAVRVPTSPAVPVRRSFRVVDLLEASTKGRIGEQLLEWRPDALTDVALYVWRKIASPLLAYVEEVASANEADLRLAHETAAPAHKGVTLIGATSDAAIATTPTLDECTDLFIKAASAVHRALSRLDVDDALLRARVGLSLAYAMRGKKTLAREAIQVVVSARGAVSRARARAVRTELHAPVEALDHEQLARQSITTDVDDASVAAAGVKSRLGAHGYGGSGIFGAGSALDAMHQALAAADLDLVACRAQLESDACGPDVAEKRLFAELRKHAAAKAIVSTVIAGREEDEDDEDQRRALRKALQKEKLAEALSRVARRRGTRDCVAETGRAVVGMLVGDHRGRDHR